MSFRVNMHQFEKRDNSTKRPSGDGTVLWCNLRRGSSLITPVMEFDFGAAAADNPIYYNYMYVPEFKRYYFIEDWTFSGGLWIASCICDVLATYKTEIGSTSMYVLRASGASNGNITDEMYPAKTGCSFEHEVFTTPWTLTGGKFVLGIVNQNPTIGGLCYFIADNTSMANLIHSLLSDDFINGNGVTIDGVTKDAMKGLIDPAQYIKSAIYIPYACSGNTWAPAYVNGWQWDAQPGARPEISEAVDVTGSYVTVSHVFDIPKHPQASSRGAYLNQAPFSVYTLMVPPFGVIQLDSTILRNASQVGVSIRVDLPTGLGIMQVSCNGVAMHRLEAQVGVPVQLSQVSRDYVGAVSSILSGAASVTAGALSGPAGIAGGIGAGVGAIGDAVKAMTPRAQTMGSGGSYAQLLTDWRLDAQFFSVVDEDNTHNGRPLCEMRTPASLGGYMIIRDGDVAIPGTSAEDSRVRDYLQTGFYYE